MANIKNIIFDLGGVLLNIDTSKTNAAFEELGISDFKNNYSLHKMDSVFENLETGKISEKEFYNNIKTLGKNAVSSAQVRDAWNALLLDFRTESLAFLNKIAPKYKLYLLSNTNSIHFTAFTQRFSGANEKRSFNDFFTKAYYSHIIGLRKPGKEIYSYVLEDAGITAAETLFIDDLELNIEGARSVGIQTHLLLPHQKIEQLGFI